MYSQIPSILRWHPWAIPVMVAVLVGVQSAQLVPYMTQHEAYPDYEQFVLPFVYTCELDQYPERYQGDPTRNPVAWWLRCAGFELAGYPNFFLVLFNMAVMPMTYLAASAITRDRLLGFISLVVFINLPLYKDWSDSGTYDMTWAFFVMMSVYLMYRFKGTGSLLALGVAIAAKSMVLMYWPAWLYSAIRTRQKTAIIISMIMLAVFGVLVYDNLDKLTGTKIGFYPENWEQALFRNISLLWQVIPLMLLVGGLSVAFKVKDNMQGKQDVIVWILCILLTTPIIHLFSEQLTFTYRFVVFGAFLSMFAAIIMNQLGIFYKEWNTKRLISKLDANNTHKL